MSGQLSKTNNCYKFGDDLSPNYMTFAKRFSQYAYNTVCSGKLHHNGPDQMQGWTKRIAADTELSAKHIEGKIEAEFAKYTQPKGIGKWSNQREVEEACGKIGPYQRFDRFAVDTSLEFLERYFVDADYQRPQYHRPLLHKVSLLQPHYPFFGDEELYNYYLDKVSIFDEPPCDHPVLSLSQQNKPVDLNADQIRKATASYYAMTDKLDSHFGEVIDQLKNLGQDLDDWIIVYTTDHGEMLGEHGIWEKTRFYEGSVRVPLIIRWPNGFKGGKTIDQNVNLCDLFATLCDLAGLECPEGLDSRSLVPLINGDTNNWNNETISQIRQAIKKDTYVMIKQDHLKYQYYGEDIPEVLFDLNSDPKEKQNLANDKTYITHMKAFRGRLAELGFGPNAKENYINAGYN
jgi:choline-sulfatase